jgi:hypothetical protein
MRAMTVQCSSEGVFRAPPSDLPEQFAYEKDVSAEIKQLEKHRF